MWAERANKRYPTGLVPINWFVSREQSGKFEAFPFQHDHVGRGAFGEDFLTFYHWPVNANTKEPLNWLELPVADKLWNEDRADKGGFIQQATRWKPSISQPYVYLPSLMRTRREVY